MKLLRHESFAERVKHLRQENSLSASDLAKLANVTPASVWHWENNGTIPRQTTVSTLAGKLGVTEQYLLTGDNRDKPSRVSVPAISAEAAPTAPRDSLQNASLEDLLRAIEAKGFSVSIRSKD